jgi:hypothetical protein
MVPPAVCEMLPVLEVKLTLNPLTAPVAFIDPELAVRLNELGDVFDAVPLVSVTMPVDVSVTLVVPVEVAATV